MFRASRKRNHSPSWLNGEGLTGDQIVKYAEEIVAEVGVDPWDAQSAILNSSDPDKMLDALLRLAVNTHELRFERSPQFPLRETLLTEPDRISHHTLKTVGSAVLACAAAMSAVIIWKTTGQALNEFDPRQYSDSLTQFWARFSQ